MAKGNTVQVTIVGDSSKFDKVVTNIETKSEGMGRRIAGVFGGLQLDRAVQGVFKFGNASVDAFVESEQSAAKLADAFARFPALADSNVGAFQRLNEQLATKVRFDDDALASGQAVLAQFGLTGQQVQQMTPLLADFAAKTGQDLPSAADQLGKALLGQGRALKGVGIDFQDAGSVGANFEQIMGGLRTQVGGFAEKEGTTAAGKSAILANQFGELQEMVGAKLVPVLHALTSAGLGVINFITSLSPGMQMAIGIGTGLLGLVFLVTKAVQAWAAVQAALNVVLAANPIGLVVIAIAALVAGIVWAYNNVGWFRDGVQSAFRAVAATGEWLGRVFSSVWGGIVSGFVWVRDTLKSIANWLISNVINKFVDAINLLIRGYNRVNIGQADMGEIPRLPTFHQGGVVPGAPGADVPILAQAGETIIPAGRSAGTNVTINFNGPVNDPDQVTEVLNRFFSRGGALTNGRGGTLAPA